MQEGERRENSFSVIFQLFSEGKAAPVGPFIMEEVNV